MNIVAGDQVKPYDPFSGGNWLRNLPRQANPSPSRNSLLKGTPGDQYGVNGWHDWYLILLALAVLYGIMRLQPKWGMPLGWLVLLGAVLSTKPAVDGFNSLVKSIQTGSLQ